MWRIDIKLKKRRGRLKIYKGEEYYVARGIKDGTEVRLYW
jgi:hypothetical protein